ncbi:DUF3568 family protein [Francisella sp. LA112445]|uniref:DUF3568 family protein n=1 Tax=Francisella sp. LA112445 TaxID=1395624 RepID=UPI001788B2E6|nr:DUF3568 family protein [Francisella sp. LA112445]QIW10612.1 DUF3568 family protein [Francisella sp. LA112445]
MRSLKLRSSVFVLVIIFALIYGCSTFGTGSYYKDGYYITTINQSFNKVYSESLRLIKTGVTRDNSGNEYSLKVDKKLAGGGGVIVAESNTDNSDFIEVVIQEQSKDNTRIAVKHGSNGDTIGSSAFVTMIQDNLSKTSKKL